MRPVREVYVLTRVLAHIPDLTFDFKKFMMYRTLELYYRWARKGERLRRRAKDMRVMVCFRLMDKLHGNDRISNDDLLQVLRDLRTACSAQRLLELEAEVLHRVDFRLLPCGGLPHGEDLLYVEGWRFESTVPLGNYEGPRDADVQNAVECHIKAYNLLSAVATIGKKAHSNFFFLHSSFVCEDLRAFHEAMVAYCRRDAVFGVMLYWQCKESFHQPPMHTRLMDVDFLQAPERDLVRLKARMASALCSVIYPKLQALAKTAAELRERALGGAEANSVIVRDLLALGATHEPLLQSVVDAIRVHPRSASRCNALFNDLRGVYLETFRAATPNLSDEEFHDLYASKIELLPVGDALPDA